MNRRTVLAAAAAVLATTLPAAASPGGDVLAYGRNIDGVCTFDEPVDVTNRAVRTDDECRLLSASSDDFEFTVGPQATYSPKVLNNTYGSNPNGGLGVPGTSFGLERVASEVGVDPSETVTNAVNTTSWAAWARWYFYDELGHMIYHDELDFSYKRARDGRINAIALTDGHCETGSGVFPHKPGIQECTWQAGNWGGSSFSFGSGGVYADVLAGAYYDMRSVGMSFATWSDGDVYAFCTPLKALPQRWSTPGCRVGTKQTS